MRRQLVYCGNHGGLMNLDQVTKLCTEQANWDDWVITYGARHAKRGPGCETWPRTSVTSVSWCAVVTKIGKHLGKP